MAIILCIETATAVCSVSVCQNGRELFTIEKNEANIHASVLTLFIQEAFQKTKFTLKDIDAVAVSKGPGSYTGLRIGVSTAKGICYALDKPLISVNTLQAMVYGLQSDQKNQTPSINQSTNQPITNFYSPMLDARRMEVYTALFDQELNFLKETSAVILDEKFLNTELKDNRIIFFGNGVEKCEVLLSANKNTVFVNNFYPSAKFMAELAHEKFLNKDFEDVAYFEPFYLKDFVVSAKKNINS